MKITYRIRRMIDNFTCIDTEKTLNAVSMWECGGLIYFKVNQFNTISIAKEDIIKIIK
ncbi:MAG: hypothetical protein II304_07485 [Bacteroidales bacterium]|nr:hypothetical protein [Bacteroidales bacterium]